LAWRLLSPRYRFPRGEAGTKLRPGRHQQSTQIT
jgi:hypothetical protein